MKKNEAEGIERDSMAPKEKNSGEGARKRDAWKLGGVRRRVYKKKED